MRRCPSCIKSKSTYPKHGPIQIRIFDGPFDTDGQLPTSSSGESDPEDDCDEMLYEDVCEPAGLVGPILFGENHLHAT
ncbi:hypothetical protein P5673_021019 [Acropora cervicornis]|uniref:Uncharacterized protein n=1 Tax=Acropora cervicornis TaxID=6130 RepID=A0AAD9Q8R4_ACRCE|nr:hypothetical protein P5673_021019 [Acropora cervicornis]